MKYDAFICHASEDKEDFVRPLANLLRQKNINVWYDEFSLTIGDSLMQKIDEGLAKSRYGIVVLSPSFFNKPWAKRELSGLTSREMIEGRNLILPIWHRVDALKVAEFSFPLADKKAANSADGINAVIRELIEKIKPEESPLVIAFDYLSKLNFEPPPISDEWWLDLIETKEFLKFPDLNIGKRWIFPLPFMKEDHGKQRGINIAQTALQLDWSFEGEELNIDPTTHPDIVHKYLRRWPGLYDCARANPKILALYVPQLTIPGFDLGFEDVFDELLKPNNDSENIIFSYGKHDTVDNKKALCADIISLRHPTFGNYTLNDLGRWYFDAHDTQYYRSTLSIFDGLVWLMSTSSNWLPDKYQQAFSQGILLRDDWIRNVGRHNNSFLYALITKERSKFKLTQTAKKGFLSLISEARNSLSIKDSSEEIAQKLLGIGLIDKYYDYQEKFNRPRS